MDVECKERWRAIIRVAVTSIPLAVAGLSLYSKPAYSANQCDAGQQDAGSTESCWYMGAGYGYSYLAPENETNNFLLDESEDNDAGFNVYLGRQLSSRWQVELRYAQLGEAGIRNRNPAINAAYPDAALIYDVPSLMAIRSWRSEDAFQPFLKLGISTILNDARGAPFNYEQQSDMQLAFGAGFDYVFSNRRLALRADADFYDQDAWYGGLSLLWRFGNSAPAEELLIDTVVSTVHKREQPVIIAAPADSDGDGVVDSSDLCANTLPGTAVDEYGCELPDVIQLRGILFDTNSAVLRPQSSVEIRKAAELLFRYPNMQVEIAGHTDNKGSSEYNMLLSSSRANSVRNQLIDLGVRQSRLSVRGYGETAPITANTTEQGRRKNRRVEMRIVRRP